MNDFILIIISPKKFFLSLKENKQFKFFSLLFILLFIIVYAILNIPVENIIAKITLSSTGLSGEQLAISSSIMSKMKYLTVITSPFVSIAMFLVYSLILQVVLKISKIKVSYSAIMQMMIVSYFVIVIGDIVNVLLVNRIGLNNISSQFDIYKIGLNLLFNPENIGGAMYTALYYINPFQLWFVILIALGIRIIADVKTKKTVIITLIFWFITVIIPVGITYLGEMMASKAVGI